jgi:serine/threonine-protein kinase
MADTRPVLPVLGVAIEVLPSYAGQVLLGKYIVLGGLGAGSMGTVYEAENLSVGRHVALKILNPQFASNHEAALRFQREARAAAKIGHPNIVDILDMGRTDEGLPFIVMEFLEGRDLYNVLSDGVPLILARAVDIAIQVLEALGAAHAAGIVHRDIKPENVFLTQRGSRSEFVKLLDFGIAKFQDASEGSRRMTVDGTTLGTPMYMSPEQARGRPDIDARTDIYSVGVLLFEMLSGRPPYPGDNYNQIIVTIATEDAPSLLLAAPWIPGDLVEVVDRARACAREERFQSAAEFISALEPFAQIGVVAPPVGRSVSPRATASALRAPTTDEIAVPAAVPPPDVSSRRSRRLWIGGVALAAVGSLGLLFAARADHQEPARRRHAVTARWVAPPPVAPPRARVSLDVVSNAQGARVLLDGRLIGLTPLHQLLLEDPGNHLLRVEAEGYRAEERTIALSGPLRIAVDLRSAAPQPGAAAATPPRKERRPSKGAGLPFNEF